MTDKLFKIFEGKSWDVLNECRNYIAESMSIEKEYKVIIRIEEFELNTYK